MVVVLVLLPSLLLRWWSVSILLQRLISMRPLVLSKARMWLVKWLSLLEGTVRAPR